MRLRLRTLLIVVAVAALLLGGEMTRRRWAANRIQAAGILLEERNIVSQLRRRETALARIRAWGTSDLPDEATLLSRAERELTVEAEELRQKATGLAASRRELLRRW